MIIWYEKKILQCNNVATKFGGNGKRAQNAYMRNPTAIFEMNNEVFFADSDNHVIRKVDRFGIISTIAGIPGKTGYTGDGGPAANVTLHSPNCIYVTYRREVYFCDNMNHSIRRISANGIISTITGTGSAGLGSNNLLLLR